MIDLLSVYIAIIVLLVCIEVSPLYIIRNLKSMENEFKANVPAVSSNAELRRGLMEQDRQLKLKALVDRLKEEEGFIPYPKDIGDGKRTFGYGLTWESYPKLLPKAVLQGKRPLSLQEGHQALFNVSNQHINELVRRYGAEGVYKMPVPIAVGIGSGLHQSGYGSTGYLGPQTDALLRQAIQAKQATPKMWIDVAKEFVNIHIPEDEKLRQGILNRRDKRLQYMLQP